MPELFKGSIISVQSPCQLIVRMDCYKARLESGMKQFLLALFLIAVPVAAFTGFEMKFGSAPAAAAGTASLGDLSALKAIITDVQSIADKGDMVAAEKRIRDFENDWDVATKSLRGLNKDYWGHVDDAADAALKDLRASKPDPASVKASLAVLMDELNDPSKAP